MARLSRIGFLVDGLLSRYQVRLFDAIRTAARRRDAVVVGFPGSYLGGTDSDRPTFDGSFIYDLAGPTSVDGLIVASNLILSGFGAARIRSLCSQSRIPIVSIGPMSGITTVDVDNRSGLKQIIEHLIVDHAYRRLAFIRGPLTNPDSLDRERVFRTTLEGLGVDVSSELIVTGNFLESSGAAAVRTLLGERRLSIREIDGIVAANDQMATGAMQELSARGLRVPEDIVVVGFDDDEHARSANPPLTTVAQPIERLGETAVHLLLDKIAGNDTVDRTILETQAVIRRSCGCRIGKNPAAGRMKEPDDLGTRLNQLREASIRRFAWFGADANITAGMDRARDYLLSASDDEAADQMQQLERIVIELASTGMDPLRWQDVLSPMIEEVMREGTARRGELDHFALRGQKLYCLFSELSGVTLLKEQLRTVELANSLRVIGSAVVCARNFRALERVLDVGLPSLDVRYCCVCTFTNEEHSRARVATVYHPTVPRPHNQIHSAEQLWRAVPPTLPPGVSPSSIGNQSFSAAALLPPNTSTPESGDFLIFPLMFGEEALGYVVLDAPVHAQRSWLLEGLSGHLSSAIYEISRTEQLRLARELAEEANSAKTTFVAMMSHEVRTPLNAIMGHLDMCLKTDLTKDQRKQLIRAQTSSRALRSIVDDILDYSRVEAHRVDLESVPFELEDVLEQVISSCAPEAGRKNLELVVDVDCDVPERLIGDPLRITQVLLNLVNNAVKFSTRGFVALRIAGARTDCPAPLCLRFSIEDTGIGMGPDQLARIFQPFTQADSSITRRYGGTGLGLTICQRLIELMGGEILVRSSIGVGSNFEFTIPLKLDGEAATTQPMPSMPVVLAIDNVAQLGALSRLFEGLGHQVHSAHTGSEALRLVNGLYSKSAPRQCFVFADYKLSDISGAQLSRSLERLRRDAGLMLVLLVPHDNDALLAGAWQDVASDTILAKPALRSSIERILRGTRSSHPCSTAPIQERQTGRVALMGRRILVVQDSEMSRELACDLLTLNGAEVHTACDGAEAISMACSESYDLVLMDLHLPGVDGCTASRTIRERHQADALPIIALSASCAPEDRERCLEAGMNDFLRAPIGAAELIDTVQMWLAHEIVSPRISTAPPSNSAMRLNAAVLPVLDVAKALGRLGGNRVLYHQLLKRFGQTHSGHIEELSNLLDDAEYERAASLVHILVSSAGNIGATRLQHAAQGLEAALRQSQTPRILAVRPRFETEWHAAIHAVAGALERFRDGSQSPPPDPTSALGSEQIEQLRKLIDDHDTAAVELVESLQETCVSEPHVQKALQRLAHSVSSYDFAAAQLHLDSLCASMLTSVSAPTNAPT